MFRPSAFPAAAAFASLSTLIAGCALVGAAHAGEVRVDATVSGTNVFLPRAVNVNLSDHVIWVWTAGSHTCTSGDSATGNPDGKWDTGFLGSGTPPTGGSAFSFQFSSPGVVKYFCGNHIPDMAGRVIVDASGDAVSDLRMTEVQYNEPGGHDLIEIANMGAAAGDLGRYRFSAANGAQVALAADNIPIAAGATVTVHTNESGTNTATDVFLPALGALPDAAGAVALYAPNTKNTLLTDATQLIDYVEWGATGGPNEATALSAGAWTGGAAAPAVASGHDIEFCGSAQQHAGRWFDNDTPNFGGAANNCVTPTRTATWGRIKTLYR